MVIYYTIFIALYLCCFFYKAPAKTQLSVMKIWVLIFTLFGGLRWHTGSDWDAYLFLFNDLDWSNFYDYSKYGEKSLQKIEPLFAFMNVIIKTVFQKYYWFNIIECFVIHFAYYKFSKYHLPKCPILCFVFLEIICIAYFPVRQTLAASVLFLGLRYIKERKLVKYLLFVFVAFYIHKMSIVALPLYWLQNIHLKDRYAIAVFLSFIVIGKILQDYFVNFVFLLGGELGEVAQIYTENQTVENTGLPIITLIVNGMFLFIYLYIRRKFNLRQDDWYNQNLNMYLMFVGTLVVFANGMNDLTRLIIVFLPGHCLLFSSIAAYSLKGDSRCIQYSGRIALPTNDRVISVFKLFLGFLFFAYCAYRIPQCFSDYFFKYVCIPYRTIFDFPSVI